MAETRQNAMPMVECPLCGNTHQWDDYYDVKVGSEQECSCGATLEVTEIEYVMYCTVQSTRAGETPHE